MLLFAVDLVLGGLRIAQLQQLRPVPTIALPGPTAAVPATPPVIAQRDFVLDSAQRQLAKARPVLLGELDLAGYCERTVGPFSLVVQVDGDWGCVQLGVGPVAIPLNAACRAQFDSATAVARLAGQTWRCYRDPS